MMAFGGHMTVWLFMVLGSLAACASMRAVRLRPADIGSRVTPWSCGNDEGDDHLLDEPRNTCGDPRGRSGGRDLHRAGAIPRGRRERLQRPRVQGPPGHAIRLR